MNIGKNITAFRKAAGMTQEELAGQIGVSAQAVSKWETGTSMPDILLLPVIADVFGVTVDELYTGKQAHTEKVAHLSFRETPEAVYHAMLKTMERAWPEESPKAEDRLTAEWLLSEYEKDDRCASFIASENGGAVLANADGAIVLRSFGTKKSFEILESGKAFPLLEALLDEKVRRMIACLTELGDRMFTAAGIARRMGMTTEDAMATLEKMCAVNLLRINKVEVEGDDDVLRIYSNTMNEDHARMMEVCLILRLAELAQKNHFYHGYRGTRWPVDPEVLR
ncbi:MAG: helix-turn-helix domain-containing protein [Eubacteriales bacterium]